MILDTMVAAYACFDVPGKSEESRAALSKAESLYVPDSFRAEFLNVAWQYGRTYKIHAADLAEIVQDGYALPTGYIDSPVLWQNALALALEAGHSPYDTLFVAAAMLRKTQVLTYDKKMLKAFPQLTISVPDYLA